MLNSTELACSSLYPNVRINSVTRSSTSAPARSCLRTEFLERGWAKIAGLVGEIVAAVIERTGGVPLFAEELTRAVLDSGDDGLVKRAIPVSLNDSLMARLDRLGPAKQVAQVGAVIGSEFSYELIHAVHPMSEEYLQKFDE